MSLIKELGLKKGEIKKLSFKKEDLENGFIYDLYKDWTKDLKEHEKLFDIKYDMTIKEYLKLPIYIHNKTKINDGEKYRNKEILLCKMFIDKNFVIDCYDENYELEFDECNAGKIYFNENGKVKIKSSNIGKLLK